MVNHVRLFLPEELTELFSEQNAAACLVDRDESKTDRSWLFAVLCGCYCSLVSSKHVSKSN